MKRNCWEAKNCGREPGGAHVHDLGVCPAATDNRLHGAHHGQKAGRACWVLAGTLCGGKTQGSFAAKLANCLTCDFYKEVKSQEGDGFIQSAELLQRIAAVK